MPELAEVEIVRRNLTRWWVGRAADAIALYDPAALTRGDAAALDAAMRRPARAARRRGKYLLVDLGDDLTLLFHFRMTGKIAPIINDTTISRLAWRLPEVGWLAFQDSRRLGEVALHDAASLAAHPALSSMGPEPHELPDGDALGARLTRGARPLKDALLDQRVIAGVGNIAISEVFWRLGLHPEVRCDALDAQARHALARELPAYFDWLVADQQADELYYLSQGKVDNPFTVYRRDGQPCPRCASAIARHVRQGRSTYYCPQCQSG